MSQPFRIFETRRFVADLAKLGPDAKKRIEVKLRDYVYPLLRENPYWGPAVKRLKNWEPPTWRYRAGEWRFFYEVHEESRTVFMTTADHRKQAYR
ncbi:MAG: type II toxin-antitoxin system RelE family toxin [Terriglobia bacterium]